MSERYCPSCNDKGEAYFANGYICPTCGRKESIFLRELVGRATCRSDGRCQYAIDHGAEGLGHCPPGKCCMPG